jgi:hypothetical protein
MAEVIEQLERTVEDPARSTRRVAHQQVVPPRVTRRRSFLIFAAAAFVGYLALLVPVRSNRKIRGDLAMTIYFQRQDHLILARVMAVVSWFGFRSQSLVLPASAISDRWFLGVRLESVCLLELG